MVVLNEEAALAASVQRIFEQDYPGEFELVIAVGPSQDDTWGVATRLAEQDSRLTVVPNPTGFTPHGLNAAIGAARHDILVRADGHAFLPDGYLSAVVALLESSGAANVGGRMVPEGDGPVSGAVAVAMSSRFGIGGAAFHVGGAPGPQPTVYLGAFRRSALEAIGGYDEHFLRAQDWELNHRLREAGFVVWFDPALGVSYHPRSSWRAFAQQQFRTGGWRRRVIETHRGTASLRYLAPPLALLGVLAGLLAAALSPLLGSWLLLGLVLPLGYFGMVTVLGLAEGRGTSWPVRLRVPVAFAVLHLAWGAGFLLRAR
jgi:glycosyltransferase involved in cell wall biosynthesis